VRGACRRVRVRALPPPPLTCSTGDHFVPRGSRAPPSLTCATSDHLIPRGSRAPPLLTCSTGEHLNARGSPEPPPALEAHAPTSFPGGGPVSVAAAGTRPRRTGPRSRRSRCKAKVYLAKPKATRAESRTIRSKVTMRSSLPEEDASAGGGNSWERAEVPETGQARPVV